MHPQKYTRLLVKFEDQKQILSKKKQVLVQCPIQVHIENTKKRGWHCDIHKSSVEREQ
jgi:hypothetical protein